MGNRQAQNHSKENSEPDGKTVERSGSKRGSGRKKKDAEKVGQNTGNDVNDGKKKQKKTVDGKKKSNGKAEVKADGKEIRKAVDDSELGMRPKMGRLSRSFAVAETRSGGQRSLSTAEEPLRPLGATPRTAELKIYRSYSSLADEKLVTMFDGQPSLANVKIYRKAPEKPLNPSQRALSLPRGFGRTGNNPLAEQSNGSAGGRGVMMDRGTWNEKRMSAPAMRSATLPRLHGNAVLSSGPAAGYRVAKNDFPDTLNIQRKVKQFESMLVRGILAKFSRLGPEAQLSAIPVAIRPGRPNQLLTLRDYLEDPGTIPDDVTEWSASGELILCVPAALFTGMAHFRRERYAERNHWPTLSGDVVTCVAAEAAAEISRMFEYQIALLAGDSSIALLAEHCAERVLSFVFYDLQVPRFDRNTVVQGAVRGKRPFNAQPQNTPQNPIFISVIIGLKELKWNLFDILDKPGLRKDVLLVHESIPAPGDDDRCPWKFYTSQSSDPMLYGYRGQLVEWDFIQGHFRVNGYDEASFSEEMCWRYDDFHRLYPPYRRLFGARAMKRYYTEQTKGNNPIRFDRFLQQAVQGAAYARDAIQPVYRPLEPFNLADVDGVDLSSADVPRFLVPKKGGGYDTQAPLSPSGEFPVFTPALSREPQFYSQGGSTLTAPRRYGSVGGEAYTLPQRYSSASMMLGAGSMSRPYSPSTGSTTQYHTPGGGTLTAPQSYPAEGRQVSPLAKPYSTSGTANTTQYYSPSGGTVPQSYSAGGAAPTLQRAYSPGGGTFNAPQSYSSGGEQSTLPRPYSPYGATTTTTQYYTPGGGTLAVPQFYSTDGRVVTLPRPYSPGGGTMNTSQYIPSGSAAGDPSLAGYTLVEEVTTVRSLKASNV